MWTRQISFPVSGGLGTSVLQVALGQKGLVSRPTGGGGVALLRWMMNLSSRRVHGGLLRGSFESLSGFCHTSSLEQPVPNLLALNILEKNVP